MNNLETVKVKTADGYKVVNKSDYLASKEDGYQGDAYELLAQRELDAIEEREHPKTGNSSTEVESKVINREKTPHIVPVKQNGK